MKTSSLAVFACACVVSLAANAQTVHKCQEDGKLTYTNIPCHGGATTVLTAPDAPAPNKEEAQDAQAELKRMQKQSAALQKERLKRDADDERDAERANRVNAARQQRCAKLKLDKKWADEDLKGAQPQHEERARLKAQRAGEKLAAGCPA